jgi:hypothetical protein
VSRLTKSEKKAICSVLHERLAGCPEDLSDALGVSKEEAEKTWDLLASAVTKLTPEAK